MQSTNLQLQLTIIESQQKFYQVKNYIMLRYIDETKVVLSHLNFKIVSVEIKCTEQYHILVITALICILHHKIFCMSPSHWTSYRF